MLLRASDLKEIEYGEKIIATGKIEKIENFEVDGESFDYISYLKKDNVAYEIKYPEIEYIEKNNGSKVKSALFLIKRKGQIKSLIFTL